MSAAAKSALMRLAALREEFAARQALLDAQKARNADRYTRDMQPVAQPTAEQVQELMRQRAAQDAPRYAEGGEVKTPWLMNVPAYSRSVAYEMYPSQQGQDDQQDAARHMLAAGTLARKYGPGVATFLGKAHEWSESPLYALRMLLGRGQMPPDYEPDLHNNQLGIGLAQQAKSQADLERLVNMMAERAAPGIAPGRPALRKAAGGLAQMKECSCHG